MTALNFRKNMANLAYLTASGLVKAGDKIANAKVPSINKGKIQYSVDNIRRNIANTINPDWFFSPLITMIYSFRIRENNYVTMDVYKSPGLRNKLSRMLAKLFKQ